MRQCAQSHRAGRQARGRSLPNSVPVLVISAKGFVGQDLALNSTALALSDTAVTLLLPAPHSSCLDSSFLPITEDPGPPRPSQPPLALFRILGLSKAFPPPFLNYIWSFFLWGFISLFLQTIMTGKGQP